MRRIIEAGGLILSEFPPGTPARKEHFPQRNRIISGISQGTLVIEAPTRSGSLITARFALEQNREVFAVPGPITSPYSWGPNFLILQGAHPVLNAENILDELGIKPRSLIKPIEQNSGTAETEDPILAHISTHPVLVDELVRKSGQPAHVVNAHLTALEIQHRVKNVGGGRYIKT
jgi:DNA processing protein